jgi:hypothetical protein
MMNYDLIRPNNGLGIIVYFLAENVVYVLIAARNDLDFKHLSVSLFCLF